MIRKEYIDRCLINGKEHIQAFQTSCEKRTSYHPVHGAQQCSISSVKPGKVVLWMSDRYDSIHMSSARAREMAYKLMQVADYADTMGTCGDCTFWDTEECARPWTVGQYKCSGIAQKLKRVNTDSCMAWKQATDDKDEQKCWKNQKEWKQAQETETSEGSDPIV